MDQIKTAFQKVKQDMDLMKEEIDILKQFLSDNKEKLASIEKTISELSSNLNKTHKEEPKITSNDFVDNPAHSPQNPTIPTHNPAHNMPLKPLNNQNIGISTGNRGVPTDRQTDRQTNQQTQKASFDEALNVLNSLDNMKKEIRNQFKRITEQEFLVFSTIYQIAEENGYADYKTVSTKLNLTESSIRDYVGRLVKKGIPVEKKKINNKLIQLSISEKLKKVVSLPIILQLRGL